MRKRIVPVDTLRLSEPKGRAVFAQLSKSAASRPVDRRGTPRFPYMVGEALAIRLEGSEASLMVRGWDLCSDGIGFLHGDHLQPNQPCAITLRTVDDEEWQVSGKITDCRLMQGLIHVVGMTFDRPIQIDGLVQLPSGNAADGRGATRGPVAIDYPFTQIAELAHRMQALAASHSSREELQELLDRLTVMLAVGSP